MNVICSAEPCPVILSGTCVFYEGANLIYTGINTNDNLQTALQKIDAKFQDAGLGYTFNNGLIQSAPGNPVQLGGSLIQNTTITGGGFTFTFTGDLYANKFVTIGGTSSQFVKGDGSLDNTSYQPAGSYITALTGDGTASGPGSAVFSLDPVSALFSGTWGSATQVPRFVLDTKGRILSVTNVPISLPPTTLLFSGDVFGSGPEGTNINLTISNVLATPGTFGSTTQTPVITVNAKGQVTAISQVPTSGGGGTGTVTNVSVTPGIGISASVANPTTTPNITITNTAPDQTVVLNNGTGISVTGTYPNFTITNTSPSSGGTVTGVTASSPLFSSGGTTPNITIQQASGSQNGFLSSIDWTTFNSKEPAIAPGTTSQYWRGDKTWQTFPTIPTVTPSALTKVDDTNVTLTLGGTPSTALLQSVSLTLGWTGTLADSRIASATTWNAKQDAITLTTTGTSGAATFIANTLNIPQYQAALTNPVTGTGAATQVAFWNATSSITGDNGLWWDNTNKYLGVGTNTPAYKLDVNGAGYINGDLTISSPNYLNLSYVKLGGSVNAFGLDYAIFQSTSTNAGISIVAKPNGNPPAFGYAFSFYANDTSTLGNGLVFVGDNATQAHYISTAAFPGGGGWPMIFGVATAGNSWSTSADLLVLTPGQNVGIGTTTPSYKLDVNGTFHTVGQNTLDDLAGTGTRMVVADSVGLLSTQTIPTGGSSRSVNVVSTNTAAGSASGTDYVYLVSGTTTITLPTAVGNTNLYTIKRVGTGVVSIATTSSETIDGSASPININVQYVSLDLISDGTNWNII